VQRRLLSIGKLQGLKVGAGVKISLGGEGYTVQRKILESERVEFDEKDRILLSQFGWKKII
jgi:alkylated DNA nucleotide flippase Atl1